MPTALQLVVDQIKASEALIADLKSKDDKLARIKAMVQRDYMRIYMKIKMRARRGASRAGDDEELQAAYDIRLNKMASIHKRRHALSVMLLKEKRNLKHLREESTHIR